MNKQGKHGEKLFLINADANENNHQNNDDKPFFVVSMLFDLSAFQICNILTWIGLLQQTGWLESSGHHDRRGSQGVSN